MSHFRNILKRRQNKEHWTTNQRPNGCEGESSDAKRQKIEKESPSKQ